MSGKLIGYIRVSTIDQNSGRQLEGIKLDRTFTDKASGKDSIRPNLQEMLSYARDGDTIIVHSMDRLARNLDDLRKIVFDLNKRQINIQFIKEGLTFTGEDSPMAKLLLSVMGSVAEFERSLIRERQREGIELAKKKGIYNKGRKAALSNEQISSLKARVNQGESKANIARDLNISRETLYKCEQP